MTNIHRRRLARRIVLWLTTCLALGGATVAGAQGDPRAAISGPVTLSFRSEGDEAHVTVVSDGKYPAQDRAKVIAGARMMQRQVARSCGKRCKPGKMPAPTIDAQGQLRVELIVTGLQGEITREDAISMVMGRPLPVRRRAAIEPAEPPPVPPAGPAASAPGG